MLNSIKNGLIVSCQALEDEPLHGSMIMAKMALAAKCGGAIGLRANSVKDIKAIQSEVDLPIIGLIKQNYQDSDIYITPTKQEVDSLLDTNIEMIAIDATHRKRPNEERLEDLIQYIRNNNCLVMGDISTYEEGINAIQKGVDCISTTLSGYTNYSNVKSTGPNFDLLKNLVEYGHVPVICEGKVNTPGEATEAIKLGAHAVVVGSAITRPQLITQKFNNALTKK